MAYYTMNCGSYLRKHWNKSQAALVDSDKVIRSGITNNKI